MNLSRPRNYAGQGIIILETSFILETSMLDCAVNQHPLLACQQYGHFRGTRGRLGVKRCQVCLQDTSHNAK